MRNQKISIPIVQMHNVIVILPREISCRKWSSQIVINCKRIIQICNLGEVHDRERDVEHSRHSLQEGKVGKIHLFVEVQLQVLVVLYHLRLAVASLHHQCLVYGYVQREVAERQGKSWLRGVSVVGKWRNVVVLEHLDQFLSGAEGIQSVELAYCALDGSCDISGKHLNFSFLEIMAQEAQMFNIIVSQQFSQVLMLPHSNSCKLPPQRAVSHVGIVQIVSVVPRTMSEETDNLFKARFCQNDKCKKQRIFNDCN